MATLSNEEYEQLKFFLAFYVERTVDISDVPPEIRPLAQIAVLEDRDKKKAMAGVVDAVNDCLTMSLRLPLEQIREMDRELKARGLPTLSNLRVRYLKRYAALMAKGIIRNEAEYYLVKGVLEDSGLLDEDMRKRASEMALAFEEKKRRDVK